MQNNFGFIREKIEIKMLILFVMRRMTEPITLELLTELTMCDDAMSYFDVVECIAKLVKTKHLQLKDDKYILTAKGRHNGEILEKNLPYSVKVKAENAATSMRSKLNRDSMISTSYRIDENGPCIVTVSLSDSVSDIITMELLAANEKQAKTMEKGFRKNAERIYTAIVDMMMETS